MVPPFQLSITKDQLKQLPAETFPGEITVVETPQQQSAALERLRGCDVVGFDTETRPSFRKGKVNNVSLIQISTGDHCFLFRINKLGFTPDIRQFIEDPDTIKIGLSLKDDFNVLHRNAAFTPAGFIDLQEYVKNFAIRDLALSKIYGIIFNRRISKSQRLSNWEAPELTESQQIYASIDAWACLRIYNRLNSGEFNPENCPYRFTPDVTSQE